MSKNDESIPNSNQVGTCNLSSSASSSWRRQVWSPHGEKSESLEKLFFFSGHCWIYWRYFGNILDNLKEIILKSTFDGLVTDRRKRPWYSLITLPWSVNAAVPTFGWDLRTLFWQTVNVWWTMMNSERISDELRTFGPQMSSSVPECRDSLINLSTILFSRDQAWNLQVCILLDFTNRALDIQSWWQWLGLLMSVSGDQILQSVNWKYGTWISTRKHKCSWISTSTFTTLAGFN